MAIAMTTGYSAQTEGARLCIDAASDWALTCVDQLTNDSSYVLMDYGAADGGTSLPKRNTNSDSSNSGAP